MPPAPVAVTLERGERVVSVNARAARAFPAQRVYIQLAVVGPPVFVPTPAPGTAVLAKPGVEDATPPPLVALEAITAADLDKTRDILAGAGIPRGDIDITMPATSVPKQRMGQVLIAVDPRTQDNFDRLAAKISAVTSQYPHIVGAGVVLERDRCDAERSVESAASQDANVRAALLANAAGLTTGDMRSNDAWFSDSWPNQMVCGAHVPRIGIEARAYAGTLANRPYTLSDNRAVLYRLSTEWKGRIPRVRFSPTQHPADQQFLLASHQFAIPDSEPFVSAQGQFGALVHPDAFIATFYTSPRAFATDFADVPSQLWRDLASAIKASGVPVSEIVRGERSAYVRVMSYASLLSLEKRTSAVLKQYAAYSLGVGAVPVVSDCRAVRAAVAAAAFSAARRRALAMTSAAGVRMGRVFAISDAGESIGALCHRADAPLGELVSALDAQAGDSVALTGSGAAFWSAVAVAWELHVPPAPRSGLWPQSALLGYGGIDGTFITHGTGVTSEDKTLETAVNDALNQLHGAPLQAIIDQGENTPSGSSRPQQRVLVVGGS